MPVQVLPAIVRTAVISILEPVPRAPERCAEPAYFRDLNLDQLITAVMAGREDADLLGTYRRRLGDLDVIRYRQEVFADLGHADVADCIDRFVGTMGRMRAQLVRMRKAHYERPAQWWFLAAAQTYCEAVTALRSGLCQPEVRSAALRSLADFLDGYMNRAEFDTLVRQEAALRDSIESVVYCMHIHGNRIRVTRYDGEADYAAQVLATFERFQQHEGLDHLSELREYDFMDHVEAGVLDRVAALFPDTFESLAAFRLQHVDYLDPTIDRFEREIHFYLCYRRLMATLTGAGLPFCRPIVVSDRKDVFARDTFDLALAARMRPNQASVVTNEFHLAGEERIITVTGPNQGGKTTLARTVGQLHHLAELGCPVPGSAAQLYLCDEILTHFEKEEDLDDLSGKLKDDVVRIHDILDRASARSLLVLNEIFSSTALDDARRLGGRVLQEVTALDALCVCVTFIDELTTLNRHVVSMVSTVVPEDPAQRTFRVVRQRADGRAYAVAIAEKYRLGYETIRGRLGR